MEFLNTILNRVVNEDHSDVKCEQQPISRKDTNQEDSGERAFWKERKPKHRESQKEIQDGQISKFKESRIAGVVELVRCCQIRKNAGCI